MRKGFLFFTITYLFLSVTVAAFSGSPPVPDEIICNAVAITPDLIQKVTLIDNGEFLNLPSKNKPFHRDYRPSKIIRIVKNEDGPIPCLADIYIAEDIYQSLFQLITYVNSNNGCQLVISSVYRSYQFQESLFRDKVNRIIALHPELQNNPSKAEKIVESLVARPGTSQHMTGRAVDFTTRALYREYLANGGLSDPVRREKYHYLREEFMNTKEGQLLSQNAYKFGFILPFPKGKEDLTGYQHEPWHYLYVKRHHSELIHKGKWTLPEYHSFLQGNGGLYYKFGDTAAVLKYCINNNSNAIEVFLLELRKRVLI